MIARYAAWNSLSRSQMNRCKNDDGSVIFPHPNWREKAKNHLPDSALVSSSEAPPGATQRTGLDRGRWIKADLGLSPQLC
jgi:hypothetical protein